MCPDICYSSINSIKCVQIFVIPQYYRYWLIIVNMSAKLTDNGILKFVIETWQVSIEEWMLEWLIEVVIIATDCGAILWDLQECYTVMAILVCIMPVFLCELIISFIFSH